MTQPILILAGPTASGKSALALDIAKSIDAVIINCDSKQVFKETPIITAQPTLEEQNTIPHKLYGCISVTKHCSVADWLDMAKPAISEVHATGKIPLLVGGTGLYIKSITEGLSPIPDIPDSIRQEVRDKFQTLGNEAFFEALKKKDPAIEERLNPGDSQRTQRAYEVIEATGKSLADWQRNPPIHAFKDHPIQTFFLAPPKEDVYANCNHRFEKMVDHGVIEEVQPLEEMNLDIHLPAAKAHGVPEIRTYLRQEMTLEDAIIQAQRNTRHYIKRQFTWFRGQMKDAIALTDAPYETMAKAIDQFLLTKSQ